MGRWAELVSQRAVNPWPSGIPGSSPGRPIICSRIQVWREDRLRTGLLRVRSSPEVLTCLCSRKGICGGLRTRGLRSDVSSSLTRGIYAGVTEWNTSLSQAQSFEGSNPFSCTFTQVRNRKTNMTQNHVLIELAGSIPVPGILLWLAFLLHFFVCIHTKALQ